MGEAVPKTTKLLMAIVLLTMTFFCALLAGCAEKTGDKAGDNPSAKERGARGASATNTGSAAGEPTTSGTEVGEAFAEAELRPVGGSGVSGDAVFKEVGSLGVQVELEVSGLPASASEDPEEPEQPYFAQVHGGSCSEAPKGRGHEHEEDRHTHDDHPGHARQEGGSDPALALVHLEWFLPGGRAEEYADHAEYEDPPTDELPGNTDLPLVLVVSADGTGMVTSLLEGVEPEQLTSGGPKYIDLRAPSHEAPEQWPALACADLSEGGN